MKKTLSLMLFGILMLIALDSFSQTLYFCTEVSKDGYPKNPNTEWTCSDPDGCYIYMLVRTPYDIGTYTVYFDIYTVDYYGNENFYKTEKASFDYKLGQWVWKKANFYATGTYKVYVYDGNNNLITSRSFTWTQY